jgi:DNA-directed RNA polymerase specialized sigma24 family protein
LVESARRKCNQKNGGDLVRHEAGPEVVFVQDARDPNEVLDVQEALEKLAEKSPRKAELVKLRYFLGCTIPEAAEILGIAAATAEEDWTYAKAWLRRWLGTAEKKTPDF